MFNVRTQPRTAGPLTDFAWLRPVTNRNHTRQEAHKHHTPVAPRTPDLTGTRSLTTWSPTLYRLSYGTGKRAKIPINTEILYRRPCYDLIEDVLSSMAIMSHRQRPFAVQYLGFLHSLSATSSNFDDKMPTGIITFQDHFDPILTEVRAAERPETAFGTSQQTTYKQTKSLKFQTKIPTKFKECFIIRSR